MPPRNYRQWCMDLRARVNKQWRKRAVGFSGPGARTRQRAAEPILLAPSATAGVMAARELLARKAVELRLPQIAP